MNKKPTRTIAMLKAARNRAQRAAMKAVMAAVDERDGESCRICLCSVSPFNFLSQPHHHHIIYRSRGGLDVLSNIVLICAHCHELVHRSGKLRLDGDADTLVVERYINGEWVNG